MAVLFSKNEAIKDLPFIEDKALYRGVNLALWLYLDKHWSLKNAINKASEKHSVKPKIAIERLMRQVIPEEVIWSRVYKPKNARSVSKGSAIRAEKMKKLEKDGKNHIIEITMRS